MNLKWYKSIKLFIYSCGIEAIGYRDLTYIEIYIMKNNLKIAILFIFIRLHDQITKNRKREILNGLAFLGCFLG